MSTFKDSKSSNSSVNPAVGIDTPPAVLSPEETVQYLRVLRERIPLPSNELAAVVRKRRISHVDPRFILAAIAAIGAAAGVSQVLGRTGEEVRQELDAEGRWAAVADELRALLQTILAANVVRRQRIGLLSLQTYQICQQLARDTSNEHLLAHVKEMQRLNKFGRPRRKASPQPDEKTTPPVTTK